MSGRCPTHGLALAPDGLCAKCRTERAPSGGIPIGVWFGAGAVVLLLLVFAIGRSVVRTLQATAEQRAAAEAAASAAPPPRPASTFAPAPLALVMDAGTPAWVEDEQRALPEQRQRVSVTIYETSWCPYCKAARTWLKAKNQPFFERDVEKDPDAMARMQKLNPGGGYPTIVVDGRVIRGWDPNQLDRAIDDAARRRIADPSIP